MTGDPYLDPPRARRGCLALILATLAVAALLAVEALR